MRKISWRRGALFGVYTVAILSVGATAEFTFCVDAWCLIVRPSDDPNAAIGPFSFEEGAFLPEDEVYTTSELAQNYATLYYAQYRVWKQLQADAATPSACDADIDGNGAVDMNDLISVLAYWGTVCPSPTP